MSYSLTLALFTVLWCFYVFQLSNSCILTLAKIRIGSAVELETTVVYYKRGLVFCGTDQGEFYRFLRLYNVIRIIKIDKLI